jgi:PAS domain S-box-containing protein
MIGHGDTGVASMLSDDEKEMSVVISDPSRPDMPIIFVSEEFEKQTGYGPTDTIGHNCRFLQGPDTDPAAVNAIRRAVAEQREITVDLLNYKKDGTPFWNRLRIRPLRDYAGKLLYFVGAQKPIEEDEVRPVPHD